MTKFLSRKFLLVVVSLGAGIALAFLGKLTPDFVALISALNISYHASNVFSARSSNSTSSNK